MTLGAPLAKAWQSASGAGRTAASNIASGARWVGRKSVEVTKAVVAKGVQAYDIGKTLVQKAGRVAAGEVGQRVDQAKAKIGRGVQAAQESAEGVGNAARAAFAKSKQVFSSVAAGRKVEPCPYRRSTIAICRRICRDKAKFTQFKDDAEAANAVYGRPYSGLRPATDDELRKMRISRKFLEPGTPGLKDFKAEVFMKDGKPIVAFRGTTSGHDWGQNVMQGGGLPTAYYTQAQIIANRVADSPFKTSVRYVGHSLGGGLAAAASRASGAPATTFNAAALNPMTVFWGDSASYDGHIDAVHTNVDPLTFAQENLPLPEAAANETWTLDAPAGLSERSIKNLWSGKPGDVIKDLHAMTTARASVHEKFDGVAREAAQNGCSC